MTTSKAFDKRIRYLEDNIVSMNAQAKCGKIIQGIEPAIAQLQTIIECLKELQEIVSKPN